MATAGMRLVEKIQQVKQKQMLQQICVSAMLVCAWMRSSRVVRASDCQCRYRNSPGFEPKIHKRRNVGSGKILRYLLGSLFSANPKGSDHPTLKFPVLEFFNILWWLGTELSYRPANIIYPGGIDSLESIP